VSVDPGFPHAWRQEPYYSQLRQWALDYAEEGRQLCVFVRRRCFVLLPDGDADVGEFNPGDEIITRKKHTPDGVQWSAFIRKADEIPPEERGKWTAKGGPYAPPLRDPG
jgi:hypothetical protein